MFVINSVKIFIDPTAEGYYKNILFDATNEYYNRDNCLAPFIYLKKFLETKGYEMFTADYLLNGEKVEKSNIYISLGVLKNYQQLSQQKNVILSSFFIFEPPVVAPKLYKNIKNISKYFKRVFIHNTGSELSKYLNNVPNAEKFYWPQTEGNVIENLWNNRNRKFLTLISANKKPQYYDGELYSERIKAVKFFSRFDEIDLYGFGWDKYIFYWPYLVNRKSIIKSYRGSVKSKYETLNQYDFAICFENMILSGYITEKIFDCFFVGTIPIYLGALDIGKYIPKNCFIDMRDFKNYDELRKYLKSLTTEDIQTYRENAKNYLNSQQYKPFTKEYFAETILKIIQEDIQKYTK